MLTAVTDPAIAADVLQAGAAGYVTKDLPLADLVRAVEAASRGETVVPQEMLGTVVARLRNPSARVGGTLTDRERETLVLMAAGLGVDEIAARLYLSRNTVRKHVQAVLAKLQAQTQLEAVAVARREGLLGSR